MFNITKYPVWSHKLSAQVVSLHTKMQGEPFPPTFLLFTTFHNLYSSEIQSHLIIKHDNTSSVKEENRLCKNKTDKLVLLYRWVTLLRNISLCKKKKVIRKMKARRRASTWELVLKRARYLCVKKRLHVSKAEALQKQFGKGDLRIKDLSQIDLFSLFCTVIFQFCYQKSREWKAFLLKCPRIWSHTLTHGGHRASVLRHRHKPNSEISKKKGIEMTKASLETMSEFTQTSNLFKFTHKLSREPFSG